MNLEPITDKIVPAFAAVTGVALISDASSADGLAVWAMRSFIIGCLGVIAYFLKKMVEDNRQADATRDAKIESLIRVTAAHEVMYEVWLETISSGDTHPVDGSRKTDQLHRIIQRIADSRGS